MPDLSTLAVFSAAALVLAFMPGPGIFYIVGRTIAAGRVDGYASILGTTIGGFVHVFAGVVGVSALIMTSATAFMALKVIGGVYLVYLGIKTWRSGRQAEIDLSSSSEGGAWRAFRDGIIVEATNPKTAAFFLALIPQFIDTSRGTVGQQFFVLGATSIALNVVADLVYTFAASRARTLLIRRPHIVRRLRQGSGAVLTSLGISVLLSRQPV